MTLNDFEPSKYGFLLNFFAIFGFDTRFKKRHFEHDIFKHRTYILKNIQVVILPLLARVACSNYLSINNIMTFCIFYW